MSAVGLYSFGNITVNTLPAYVDVRTLVEEVGIAW